MFTKITKTFLVMVLLITQMASAQQQKQVPWVWKKNTCETCGINFKIVGDINSYADMETKEILIRSVPLLWPIFRTADADAKVRTQIFLQTLSSEKQNILKLYANETTSQEYNLLASMAVGILGQESRFFANWRYLIKRNAQWAITEMKIVKAIIKENKDDDDQKVGFKDAAKSLWGTEDAVIGKDDVVANSKGPTQIKDVPDRIAQFYNMSEKNLWQPKYAAVATMGFLIEALKQLRRTAYNHNLTHINDNTIVDYLPYIYFGGTKKLINRTATPNTNIYVKHMKQFMKKVEVTEVIQ